MSINVKVPISTEVIESNPDCKIRGFFEKGRLVIEIDGDQNHHQRLGIGTKIPLHWCKDSSFEVQSVL